MFDNLEYDYVTVYEKTLSGVHCLSKGIMTT